MKLLANSLYHIYNQGNNKEIVFRDNDDYIRFLNKFRALVRPHCQIIAYCLMPNHSGGVPLHFLVYVSEKSVAKIQLGGIEVNLVTDGFRQLLSEFAQEVNKKYKRSGSLFRQKTKAKDLAEGDENYALTCFHYIHQNPVKANLVKRLEDWNYSSFQDYIGKRGGTLCSREAAFKYLPLNLSTIYEESYGVIADDLAIKLYQRK
jgi:putative transposase